MNKKFISAVQFRPLCIHLQNFDEMKQIFHYSANVQSFSIMPRIYIFCAFECVLAECAEICVFRRLKTQTRVNTLTEFSIAFDSAAFAGAHFGTNESSESS